MKMVNKLLERMADSVILNSLLLIASYLNTMAAIATGSILAIVISSMFIVFYAYWLKDADKW